MKYQIDTYKTYGTLREPFIGYGVFIGDDIKPIFKGSLDECDRHKTFLLTRDTLTEVAPCLN